MTAAIVHGETDTLLTVKDDKVLSSLGRIYGFGHIIPWVEDDLDVVQCFEGNGGKLFHSTIIPPPLAGERTLSRVLLDSSNHLYTLGYGAAIGSEKNLLKLDISNLEGEYWKELWSARVGSASYVITFEDMCLDNDGNIIIVGSYNDVGSMGVARYLWKVNASNGNTIWSTNAPEGICHQVAVDSNNNIYVTCDRRNQTGTGTDVSQGCLQKYNSSGTLLWGWDSGNDTYHGCAVAISSSDEIFFSTDIAVTDGEAKRWIIYVFDVDGNVLRKLESSYYYESILESVPFLKLDDQDKLFFLNIYANTTFNITWLHKCEGDFTNIWTKALQHDRWAKGTTEAALTESKRVFVTALPTPVDFEKQSLRDETTGSVIWEGDDMETQGPGRQTLQSPVFREPKLWASINKYWGGGGRARIPVRDSGCFIPPIYPYWKTKACPDPPATIEAGDIFFLPPWASKPTDQGLFKARHQHDDWIPHLVLQEGYFSRLSRCQSKPFQIWPFDSDLAFSYSFEDELDYKPYFINALVYHDGVFYKCKAYDGFFHTPPNASFWDIVDEPDPKWNSFAGFGGLGELDPANPEGTTPQIYTVVFHGVEDLEGALHPLNGIYYLSKDLGRDKFSKWQFLRNRPGGQSYRATFIMFGGITVIESQTYSNPKCWIKLELMTTPGEEWSPDTTYNSLDYCLHAGEWYLTPMMEFVYFDYGYVNCVPSDIGKPVGGAPAGSILIEYDNDLEYWWIKSPSTIGAASTLSITGGSGAGTIADESVPDSVSHSNSLPADELYWTHLLESDDDYPGYETVYQSNDTEQNYGCCYDWTGAPNQALEGMIGQNGFASVYPGIIYQWNRRAYYVTDNIVVRDGFFYKALADNTDSEPPGGPWILLGHVAA